MSRKRPTVADIRASKGKHRWTMLRVESLDELAAAEKAGVEMASVPPEMMLLPHFREVAPSVFAVPGTNFYELGTADDFLRWAFRLYKAGADAVYCSAGFPTVRRLAEDNIPVIGHVGLIPSRATWTGGFKAVGKTAASAAKIWEDVQAYEAVGAFGVEVEVVPGPVAAAISERTPLFTVGMGAGMGCDCQYLFADDVLGQNRGHVPRHAKTYRNFAAEYDRLQAERIAAFGEFVADVKSGAYPAPKHQVGVDEAELDGFLRGLPPR